MSASGPSRPFYKVRFLAAVGSKAAIAANSSLLACLECDIRDLLFLWLPGTSPEHRRNELERRDRSLIYSFFYYFYLYCLGQFWLFFDR